MSVTASTELWAMSALDLAGAIRSRQATSEEVIQAHLRRIEAVNPSINVDGRTLDAGSYVFISAGRSHGIEQVGRAGCLLFYVYLHQGTTRPAAVAPTGGSRP